MSWTSSTAIIGHGSNGVVSTTSGNSKINGDWSSDYLEIYGANDTVLASGGSDSVGAMMYPERGMYGTYAYIDGEYGSDILVAAAIQGEQYATLVGGARIDTFGIGCNSDSKINVVIKDLNISAEPVGIFYESYHDGKFTAYSTDKGLVVKDDAGRLNVTLQSVYDSNYILNNGLVWIYPHGVRADSAGAAAATVWYNGSWEYFGNVVQYGGYISGVERNGDTLTINDYHSGGIATEGIYGLDNVITIDNRQSTEARFLGGNSQSNYIFAGSGGDTLWGYGGNDVLLSGAGADTFLSGNYEGVNFIQNADSGDTVFLHNMTLNDIPVINAQGGYIVLMQDMNNSATVQYNGNWSPLFRLADGSQYRFNGEANFWQRE